jgi:tyrosine-specific transport protein
MIPTLSHYLDGDTKRVKQSILLGSLFTLIIYLFWELISLGTLPVKGPNGILESYQKGIDAAQTLGAYLQNPLIIAFASLLAFFAILTSFLAQTLSIVHFLSDGMKIKHGKRENIYMCVLALAPPLIFAIIKPSIFYQALNFAGGVCAVILFGIFPVLMIWKGRYKNGYSYPYQVQGGKRVLLFIFGIASFILIYQITTMMGYHIGTVPNATSVA